MSKSHMTEEQLREALKRCPEACIDAAIRYNKTQDKSEIPTIVLGILERFAEPEVREKIHEGSDDCRLFEDLGIDSLLIVEIIILVEETLAIEIANDELRDIKTIGDLKVYLQKKVSEDTSNDSSN